MLDAHALLLGSMSLESLAEARECLAAQRLAVLITAFTQPWPASPSRSVLLSDSERRNLFRCADSRPEVLASSCCGWFVFSEDGFDFEDSRPIKRGWRPRLLIGLPNSWIAKLVKCLDFFKNPID